MSDIKNAIVENMRLEINDHGVLDAWLMLDYGGSGQGFGGYALYLPKSFEHHAIRSPAGHFIWRCMEIAGVTKWNAIQGKAIRVRIEDGRIRAIGHITKNDWFSPSEDFKHE